MCVCVSVCVSCVYLSVYACVNLVRGLTYVCDRREILKPVPPEALVLGPGVVCPVNSYNLIMMYSVISNNCVSCEFS